MKTFFTPKEVAKIVGLSYRQIQYWDKTNFIKPSYRRRGKYRLYTFQDLIQMKLAKTLRGHEYSIQSFSGSDLVSDIIIVSEVESIEEIKNISVKYNKVQRVVPGGKTRQESSFLGLEACENDTEFVIIHDAARPFVDKELIERVLREAIDFGASSCAVPVNDTIALGKDGFISKVPVRDDLKKVQTPQAFKLELIKKAHTEAISGGTQNETDDCGLIVKMAHKVRLVEGSGANIRMHNAYRLHGRRLFKPNMRNKRTGSRCYNIL